MTSRLKARLDALAARVKPKAGVLFTAFARPGEDPRDVEVRLRAEHNVAPGDRVVIVRFLREDEPPPQCRASDLAADSHRVWSRETRSRRCLALR